MNRSKIIITDSGGVQEEAPSLGKPVLVMRDTTERPEAINSGTVKMVGAHESNILINAQKLLDDSHLYQQMSQSKNPFGNGDACTKICNELKNIKL
jgi:UDP-N-acetylglucosamine 2-epimerase (non-hydrolysing)